MHFFKNISDWCVRVKFRRLAGLLQTLSTEKLNAKCEKRLLHIFQYTARKVPAYRKILKCTGVDPKQIADVDDFRAQVPILKKTDVFQKHALRELVVGGNLEKACLFYSSSGHSGKFSYGVENRHQALHAARSLEFALTALPHFTQKKSLLVNCLPSGVEIHTKTIPLIRSSVREDVVLALLQKLKPDFNQLIIVGEYLFLKKLFEDGKARNIGWEDFSICVVTGGEYIARNAADYLCSLIGVKPECRNSGQFVISCGLSELASSIARETWETAQIRCQAQNDPNLRKALYGTASRICPPIMQYNPFQNYIETLTGKGGRKELVVSMLDPGRLIPLIRYNTGDKAHIIAYDVLQGIMRDYGKPEMVPEFRLPLIVMWGKYKPLQLSDGSCIYPEFVKEALYADFKTASLITGNFRLLENARHRPETLVHLKPEVTANEGLTANIAESIREWTGADILVRCVEYSNFPYGMRLDYERKPRYV